MNKSKILLSVIAVALVVVLAFSVFKLVQRFADYNKAEELYAEKQEQYIESTPEMSASEDEVASEKPPITVDFKGLLAENSDIVGWIYSADTPINYPVVQSTNNSTYLKLGINGEYLISGTNFVDFRNHKTGVDENYIIYGHNMKNQSMFGTIDNYRQQSYYDKHPVMYYLTPEKNYRIDLFAGKVVPYNDLIYQTSPTSDVFSNHVKKIIENSYFKTSVEYTKGDKIVTLSTCTDNSGKTRYILIGKLVEL